MDLRTTLAAQNYAATKSATTPRPEGQGDGGSFARMAEDLATTLQQAERTAADAMIGRADPHSLVQALAESQLAIETAVTVRDRVVEAYQEILRMPV
jgi:flagellar hook-basal body complex protein FliE